MRDVYLSNDRWGALVASLVALDPNQLPAGRIDASDYVMALGEAGIWPMSVLDDPGNPNHSEGVAICGDNGHGCTCQACAERQRRRRGKLPDDDDNF